MNTYKLVLLAMLILFNINVSAYNNLKSPNITLSGGTIGPRESFFITTDKCVENELYNLTCKIKNPNNQDNQVAIWSDDYFYSEDGRLSSGLQLKHVDNIVIFPTFYKNKIIEITNLDCKDSVIV